MSFEYWKDKVDVNPKDFSSFDAYATAVERAGEEKIKKEIQSATDRLDISKRRREILKQHQHFHNFRIGFMCECGTTARDYLFRSGISPLREPLCPVHSPQCLQN